MEHPQLYRKRLIPEQCIPLKDDIILYFDKDIIVTKWDTINPKIEFNHGSSCYFLNHGIKVSKFYLPDHSILYWYCDIIEYEFDESSNRLTAVDLLADVIVYEDGRVQVVDLDELAQAFDSGHLSPDLLKKALFNLNSLLSEIYSGRFYKFQEILNRYEAVSPDHNS